MRNIIMLKDKSCFTWPRITWLFTKDEMGVTRESHVTNRLEMHLD